MSRWEPNARGRLEQAALELYGERGFEQTTVAEIAARAGLTERTFFRHFADKREVLFRGQSALREFFVSAVANAPGSEAPIDAIAAALEAVGDLFEERREHSQQRQAVITANPGLQERELIKLASLASAMADALRRRAGRESDRGGRGRGVQGRVRALDRRNQPARPVATHPRVARRTQRRDRGEAITGRRSSAKS
jgi:AcrR family transcriptional regulator